MGYDINRGKASTPHLERYHRANKRIKLILVNLFVDNINDADTFGAQHTDVEEHHNAHNELINIKSGISSNTDLKIF